MSLIPFIILVLIHSTFALPRFPLYQKENFNSATIFEFPQSTQLLIEFSPRIFLRTATQILKFIASQRAKSLAADEEIETE